MTKKKYILKEILKRMTPNLFYFERINCLTNKEARVVYFTVTDKTQQA